MGEKSLQEIVGGWTELRGYKCMLIVSRLPIIKADDKKLFHTITAFGINTGKVYSSIDYLLDDLLTKNIHIVREEVIKLLIEEMKKRGN